MGEMADFCIDQMLDAYPSWSPVGSVKRKKPIVCKHCGSRKVKWRLTDGGWRLFNTKRVHPGNRMVEHDCRPAPDTDGFTNEEEQP